MRLAYNSPLLSNKGTRCFLKMQVNKILNAKPIKLGAVEKDEYRAFYVAREKQVTLMKKYITLLLLTIPAFLLAQVKESKEELIAQVKANPSRVETLKTIQRVGGYDPDYKELRDLFKGLDKSVRRSPEGKQFGFYLKRLENASVGKKAPAITQLTPEGEPFSLSDLRGKYVLIEFWASWCPDCRKANPN